MHTDISPRLWSSLRHPHVRNLAWCVFSPSLVNAPAAGPDQPATVETYVPTCSEDDFDWLQQLDRTPEPLLEWLAGCHSSRLGFQFERYWQFWWQHRDPRQDYRFNVQLSANGKTLGELDAVSWHPQHQQLTHSELAVKFYLGIDSGQLPTALRGPSAWSWVGPDVKDRLDLKWQQLQRHQLRHLLRAEHPGTLPAELPDHWHGEQLQTRLIMRGRLFYPLGELPDWSETAWVNPCHQRGVWLRLSQFRAISTLQQVSARWQILRREQWFAPLRCSTDDTLDIASTSQRLQLYYAAHRQPVQLALLHTDANAAADSWHERQRWFVVPDQWPQITGHR